MISVDVGNTSVKIVDVGGRGGSFKLNEFSNIKIMTPIFFPDGSIDKDALTTYLSKDFEDMKSTEVYITFSGIPSISNEYQFPYEPNPSKLHNMVSAKVFATLSEQEYLMDYCVISTSGEGKAKKQNVVTYVVPKRLVQDAEFVIKALGKKPVCFAVPQNSMLKFADNFFENKSFIVANVDETAVTAHLINQPGNVITRTAAVKATLPNFEATVPISIEINEKNETANGEQAEVVKTVTLEKAEVANANISDILIDVVSKLSQYQQIKYPTAPLECLFIMGDVLNDPTMEQLKAGIELPMEQLSNLDFPFFPGSACMGLYYAIAAVLKGGA